MPLAPEAVPPAPSNLRRAGKFFLRATRLRCPDCGQSPIFIPLRRTRSLRDWLTPLDGCPRCGYAYEREVGYFLLAIWGVGYGANALLGIAIYLVLETYFTVAITTLLLATTLPLLFTSVLFARHAKSYFLAFDHFVDPPVPFRDDPPDDGNRAVPTAPSPDPAPNAPGASPPPPRVVETR